MIRNAKAPKHLRPETRRFWQSVVRDYMLEDHHMKLLLLTCEALDRCAEARDRLGAEGLTVGTGDGSQKAHPLIAVERDARIAAMRGLRELDLDAETSPDARHPPALRSNNRGA